MLCYLNNNIIMSFYQKQTLLVSDYQKQTIGPQIIKSRHFKPLNHLAQGANKSCTYILTLRKKTDISPRLALTITGILHTLTIKPLLKK